MISIIIPVHDQLKHLNDCLLSIKEKTKLGHEVIISDSNSSFPMNENYYHEAERQGLVDKVVYDYHNGGFSRAINNGMSVVSHDSEFIVWLNSDTIIGTNEWLRNLKIIFSMYPDTVASGPISNSASYQTFVQCNRKDVEKISKIISSFKTVYPMTYLPNGFCVMIKAEAVKKTGLLNEKDFPHYGSEDDYFLRMVGQKRICGNVLVFHHGRKSYQGARTELTKKAVKKLHAKYDSLENCVTYSDISLREEKNNVIRYVLEKLQVENK